MQPNAVLEPAKIISPIRDLQSQGQSIWLDYIERNLITSGELQRLIEEHGVTGITSNPSIFEKAITGSAEYADLLKSSEWNGKAESKTVYEALAIRDIRDAADLLRPVYENTERRDGYVSLEVSPYLARDTQGTIHEARALWKAVDRENLMVKVPGTAEGIAAFQQLVAEGVNVNVTLLFSQSVYRQVAEAYLAGLEQFAARRGDVNKIASVASFFVSRIDTLVDAIIASRLKTAKNQVEQEQLTSLLGKVAIANAKLAYQLYLRSVGSARWKALAAKGAQTQRLLWASTSTKNPNYRDVLYIEELIGCDTVNTVPPATLDAFRHHGQIRPSLVEDLASAVTTMQTLATVGISIDQITSELTEDGVRLFVEAFAKLLDAVRTASRSGNRRN